MHLGKGKVAEQDPLLYMYRSGTVSHMKLSTQYKPLQLCLVSHEAAEDGDEISEFWPSCYGEIP